MGCGAGCSSGRADNQTAPKDFVGRTPNTPHPSFRLIRHDMNEHSTSQAGVTGGLPAKARPGPPPRILVVDDDSDIRRLNTQILERFGYEVKAAADGAAGWEALNADRYDLLITDNDMPNVSGLELIEKLWSVRMPLPVIMASGRLPTREFERDPWLQPAATLLKPYSVVEFLSTVETVLRETGNASVPNAPPPEWQRRSAAVGLRA